MYAVIWSANFRFVELCIPGKWKLRTPTKVHCRNQIKGLMDDKILYALTGRKNIFLPLRITV